MTCRRSSQVVKFLRAGEDGQTYAIAQVFDEVMDFELSSLNFAV